MSKRGSGKNNGQVITEHGYVLVYVGRHHHLADVRGYTYEHRLVAERLVGRRLHPGEQIHHRNGVKTDNRPDNLLVTNGRAEHSLQHRKNPNRRKPGEDNPVIHCQCGCGQSFPRYDRDGRPRSYVTGHNMYRR